MIDLLKGTLESRRGDAVLVDVGGVGYRVAMTPRSIGDLPGIGEPVAIHTHLYVREDQMALYGFDTAEERDLFRVLLGASGVGPKLALAILATLPPGPLQHAVLAEDAGALTEVPGVGKKTAQRLILDLRSRLELPDTELAPTTAIAEVREALEGLGYQVPEIREALAGLDGGGTVEELLKAALRRLGGA